jgi:hypothetical protein
VEGMGRINFAKYLIDRKGITDRVTLNGMTLMNWHKAPQYPATGGWNDHRSKRFNKRRKNVKYRPLSAKRKRVER